MNAHKIELLVIDHDDVGIDEIKKTITNVRHPNRCISPGVMAAKTVDIGEWEDEHPLNRRDTMVAEYNRLFRSDDKAIVDAWVWLCNHPAFLHVCENGRIINYEGFTGSLDVELVLVNPETNSIVDDDTKNTVLRYWFECGPWRWLEMTSGSGFSEYSSHDYEMDCDGATFGEALLELRELVLAKYGDYDPEYWDTDEKYLPHLEG